MSWGERMPTLSVARHILLMLLLSSTLQAGGRPKVGIALSGGGAKGLAHIGVLKVLEEVGMPIDYITGTSVGGVLGGLYAIGYSADDLEQIVRDIQWNELFSDQVARRNLSMEQKLSDARYVASLPMREGRIQLPSGLISGQKFSMLFSRLTLSVHEVEDFREFPVPFACVATDIVTGEAVVLDRGFLPEAMRASMAIPSIFTPVRVNDRLLVDGGLARNLPAEDARNLGADFVIGVDVSAPLYTEEELQSFLDILNQTIGFVTIGSTREQRQRCDVVIRPEIADFSLLSFGELDSIIARGEAAARDLLPRLHALADSLSSSSHSGNDRAVKRPGIDKLYIREVSVKGGSPQSAHLVRAELGIEPPAVMTVEELEAAINRLYSTQFFERVTYRVNDTRLEVQVIEQSDDLFRFALHYDSSYEASLLLNGLFRDFGRSNARLSVDLKLGRQLFFDAWYFIHTGWRPRFGLRVRLNYVDEFLDIFNEEQRDVRLRFRGAFAEGFLGTIFSTSFAAGLGLRGEIYEIDPRIAPADFPSFSDQFVSCFGVFWIDTMDRAVFPSRGVWFLARSDFTHEEFGSSQTFSRHLLDFRGVLPLSRRFSILTQLVAGTSTGEGLPLHQHFLLGGLRSPVLVWEKRMTRATFLGFKPQEFMGTHLQFLQIGLQHELLADLFVQLRFNLGNTFDRWRWDVDPERFKAGFGLTVGLSTPLGPVELTAMGSGRHEFLTHLNLGYTF